MTFKTKTTNNKKTLQIFKGDKIVSIDGQSVDFYVDELMPRAHYGSDLGICPELIHPVKIGVKQLKRNDPDTEFDEFAGMPIHVGSSLPTELEYDDVEYCWGQVGYKTSHREEAGWGGDNDESEGRITFNEAKVVQSWQFKASFINRRKTVR